MLLIGLDAASNLTKFGYAIGFYEGGRVRIESAGLVKGRGMANALLSEVVPALMATSQALIAVDAPLGWPRPLASELQKHKAGEPFSFSKDAMFRRTTDQYVHEVVHKFPLEVGADRIARAAHSALHALATLRDKTGRPIPLAWNRDIDGVAAIEVYPAATLKARGLRDSGYKEAGQQEVRQSIASSLAGEITGLDQYIESHVDVFDACLCLVAAKDFLDGLAASPKDMALAKREGWIWVRHSGLRGNGRNPDLG